jgi:4-amino-4-deoxy-L-arabinose transferase-like glycosyltransferase
MLNTVAQRSVSPRLDAAVSRDTIRPGWWPLVGLAVFLALRVALDAWWLWEFRQGYPLNTDEVGYLTIAFDDTQGFESGGLAGLWRAFLDNRSQAPLVPLLTVPIQLAFGQEIFPSFFVQAPFLVLLALATYGLAGRLANSQLGLLAAIVVTSIPDMTDWARAFHFGVPSAALFTAGTYALVRADGFRDPRWSLIWGVLLGLTLLARTMTIALIPGQILAAALMVVFASVDRNRRAARFALALALGIAIAATWYAQNWRIVAEYLIGFGYGDRSAYYGKAYPILSWARWTARLGTLINRGFYLPLAVLVAVTLAAGLLTALLRARPGNGATLRAGLRNGVWISIVVVTCGYVALSSSPNEGTGFALPLLPILVALVMASLARLEWRSARILLVALFLMVSAFDLVMKADVDTRLSGSMDATVPGLGAVRLIDGRGDIQRTLMHSGNDLGAPTARIPELHKQWLALGREVAIWLDQFAGKHHRLAGVVFGSKDPFYNTNLIELSARMGLRKRLGIAQLEPTFGGDNTDSYRAQLIELPGHQPPNLVVTTDPGPAEYQPRVTQSYVEAAARSLGFEQVASFRLPDGRESRIWWLDRGASP